MNDSPQEMACLDRATIWEGLIGWCEEMEGEEIEAEVGRSDADPSGTVSSCSGSSGAPALKRPKTGRGTNRKQVLKGMSRAVARGLGLI